MYYIGIDIGGMSIKGGIVATDGTLLSKKVITTDPKQHEDLIIEDIYKLIADLIKAEGLTGDDIGGIGLGIPGTVNSDEGKVRMCPNINFEGTPLVAKLSKHFFFKVPIRISNDANCAALGEALFGSVKNVTDAVMVTLGTGVGTGFLIGGKLFEGIGGGGAEGGHTVIKMGGERDGSGLRGSYEAYASVTALIRQTEAAIKKFPDSILAQQAVKDGKVCGKTVFDADEQGCPVAAKVIKKYLEYVGVGLINLVNVFRPQVIIIGGAVSQQGDRIIKPLQRYVNRFSYAPKYSPKVKVIQATLLNDAGILGAAALTMNK